MRSNNNIEKGGKVAYLRELRTFGGRQYIKTSEGWKFHGKGTGQKAKEHKAASTEPTQARDIIDKTIEKQAVKNWYLHQQSLGVTHRENIIGIHKEFGQKSANYADSFIARKIRDEESTSLKSKIEKEDVGVLIKNIFSEESTKSEWYKEKELLTALGFKDKPSVTSSEEYDKIQGTELYTGLNATLDDPESEEENKQILDQYLTQFREGDYHGSTSTHYSSEHGMNFTTDKDEAESYSKPQSEEDEGLYEGVLLKVKVKSDDLKICSREKAEELSKELSKKYNTYIPLTAAAALSGYNFSYEEDGDTHIVALNRGVLITTMKDNIQKGGIGSGKYLHKKSFNHGIDIHSNIQHTYNKDSHTKEESAPWDKRGMQRGITHGDLEQIASDSEALAHLDIQPNDSWKEIATKLKKNNQAKLELYKDKYYLKLKPIDDEIQKGGKPAIVGEHRKFGGKEYIKQSNGEWKPVAEGRQKQSKPADWSANTIEDKMKAAFKDSSNDPTTTANNKPTAWWKEMDLPPLNGYPVNVPKENVTIDLEGDIHSHAVMKWKDPKTGVEKRAYTKEFLNRNAEVKWSRIAKVDSKQIDNIKKKSSDLLSNSDSKTQEAAAIINIIAQTGLRRGNRDKFEVTGNRGVSTLAPDSITIEGDEINFSFIGKSYKDNKAFIKDAKLAKFLRDLQEKRKGQEYLFDTTDTAIDHTFEQVGGSGLHIKDMRTYVASDLATKILFEDPSSPPPLPTDLPIAKQKKLIKDKLNDCYKKVSDKLNNSPTMAKNSYIHPNIIDEWIKTLNASFEVVKAGDSSYLYDMKHESILDKIIKNNPTSTTPNINEDDEELCDEFNEPNYLQDMENKTRVTVGEARQILEKGGEGSRGGKVIGHTKSGKAIYEYANHEEHSAFTKQDHQDAMNIHEKKAYSYNQKKNNPGAPRASRMAAAQKEIAHKNQHQTHGERRNATSDSIEKGGKAAFLGEIRAFGGRDYIKTIGGWKFHGKGTGRMAQERAKSAEIHKQAGVKTKEDAVKVNDEWNKKKNEGSSDIESKTRSILTNAGFEVTDAKYEPTSLKDNTKFPKGTIQVWGGSVNTHSYHDTQDSRVSDSKLKKILLDNKIDGYELKTEEYDPGSEKGWKVKAQYHFLIPKESSESITTKEPKPLSKEEISRLNILTAMRSQQILNKKKEINEYRDLKKRYEDYKKHKDSKEETSAKELKGKIAEKTQAKHAPLNKVTKKSLQQIAKEQAAEKSGGEKIAEKVGKSPIKFDNAKYEFLKNKIKETKKVAEQYFAGANDERAKAKAELPKLQEQMRAMTDVHDLSLGYQNNEYKEWLGPGPMKISDDHKHEMYSFDIKHDKNKKTFFDIPSDETIEQNKKGRKELLDNIKSGKTVWFSPGGYGFGVAMSKTAQGNTEVRLIGRPNNAIGKSVLFKKYEIKGWDMKKHLAEAAKYDFDAARKVMKDAHGKEATNWV